MNKEALLIIDLQFDFLKGGALEVKNGNEVIPEILKLAPNFEVVILSQDWHQKGHKSFASSHPGKTPYQTIEWNGSLETLWPDHCVQNSLGAQIHPSILALNPKIIIQKGTDIEIDSYSAFFDNHKMKKTVLDFWLKENDIQKLVVCGLATDYCVLFTVLDALELGYKVNVFQPGCRAVNINIEDGEMAFKKMKKAGAKLIL